MGPSGRSPSDPADTDLVVFHLWYKRLYVLDPRWSPTFSVSRLFIVLPGGLTEFRIGSGTSKTHGKMPRWISTVRLYPRF